ncbi:MAG: fatty-acid--CoA ligase [Actinomycetota bacterium]|nr:fatty-acid--CoA ligase [Actinomycetota bacterium]
MGEYELHSFILACDFRVDDPERMLTWLQTKKAGLNSIGAHHVVVYKSIWEPRRILTTIGIRHPRSVREVLRSPAIFEWFDIAGVDDIPPVFGGEVVEKIDLDCPTSERQVAGVIVGAVAALDDMGALMVKLHDGLDRFREAGVRKVWAYQALDDGQEVMIVQEIGGEANARQWIDHPDVSAEWMWRAGLGAYPTLFVGKLAHVMAADDEG